MMNRREVILSGLAVAAMSSLAAARSPARKLQMSIIDGHGADVLAFAAHCGRSGVATKNVRGNVSELWFNDLYHRWRRSPEPIGGLTSHVTWFLLDTMARDAGMRTIYRGDHQRLSHGAMEHRLFGLCPPGSDLTLRAATGNRWAAAAATIVTEFDRPSAQRRGDSVQQARRRVIASDTLISWVIALPSSLQPLNLSTLATET